jgi:hypothetical protein
MWRRVWDTGHDTPCEPGQGVPVERVIDVPATASLSELHLLPAMGSGDVHLHEFVNDGASYGVPGPDGFAETLGEA